MNIQKTALVLLFTLGIVGCATPKIHLNTGDMAMEVNSKVPTIRAVDYAPDGKSVVSGGWDAIARHWDLVGARETKKYGSNHEGVIQSVAFSPDGRMIAVNNSNNKLTLWDTATGNVAREIAGMGGSNRIRGGNRITFSPDGKFILVHCQFNS